MVHFLHANGYPPRAYDSFLGQFSPEFHLVASELRPLWSDTDPATVPDWHVFRDDLLQFLERGPIRKERRGASRLIGMGHSIGATTTLMAAIQDPGLFQALVLIEPVIFPPAVSVLWKVIYRLGVMETFHPLIGRTLRRKAVFPDRESMFNNYRKKAVFERISDPGLRAYVEAMARDNGRGEIELRYPPEWEARIYATAALVDLQTWHQMARVESPVLLIRGAHTDTFWSQTSRRMRKILPRGNMYTMPGAGHLVPLEKPREAWQVIHQFLRSLP